METVQYKGYTILIKHYEAFRHKHREYLGVFDYIISDGMEKIAKGYDFSSAKEARIVAKSWIDGIGPMEIT